MSVGGTGSSNKPSWRLRISPNARGQAPPSMYAASPAHCSTSCSARRCQFRHGWASCAAWADCRACTVVRHSAFLGSFRCGAAHAPVVCRSCAAHAPETDLPRIDEIGPVRPKLAQFVGRLRLTVGQHVVIVCRNWAHFGQRWPKLGRSSPNLGNI